jgi:hypothetical protein
MAFNASAIVVTATGTKGRFRAVEDCGAVGDGVADDAEALQQCITKASDIEGGAVMLPTGRFRCGQTLRIPAGVRLEGVGMGSDPLNSDLDGTAILHCGSASSGPLWAMVIEGNFVGVRDLQIVDYHLDGCASNAAGGILLNGTARGIESAKFTDIFLYHFTAGTALKLLAASGGAVFYAEFYSVRVRYCKVAIHLLAGTIPSPSSPSPSCHPLFALN